jgi:hypothetical protein
MLIQKNVQQERFIAGEEESDPGDAMRERTVEEGDLGDAAGA